MSAAWYTSLAGVLSGELAQLGLSLGAAFLAAALAGLALIRSMPRRVAAERVSLDPPPPIWRLVWPLVRVLEAPANATIGGTRRIAIEARLQQAGLGRLLTPARHRAGCWVAALVSAAVAGVTAAAVGLGQTWSGAGLWAPIAGAALGGLLPVARLRDRACARQRWMLRQLPFFLDLITMSVEAGLNLGAAFSQAVDRGPAGPLRDELAHLLRDMRAGRSRDEALRALAARAQLPAVSNLVAALSSAHKQGVQLGPILRAQAEQRRNERFLRAEKLAMEAPVKMLLPLSLFIFPGTFAVLLFPVVSRLIAEGVL
ncbi:MAG: type II secretion system F family protein [Gammaproteobacteria bacterium]